MVHSILWQAGQDAAWAASPTRACDVKPLWRWGSKCPRSDAQSSRWWKNGWIFWGDFPFSIHVPSIFNHGFLLINAWKMKLLKGFSMMFLFVDHVLVIVGEVAMDGPLVFYPKCVQHQTVEKHGCGSMFCCLLTAHQLQISVPKSNLKFARHSSYV